ncbi:hypothetical protein BJ322DRAFT_1070696 [Thelephora terrestris]|uniref:Secreted protein n=1 Tax=Thelephora terrestris TaxID=56493 RepID=A0A9P6HDL1_9AGAM|nr:hypothetical protein BJ322DRAFT_1070696 [Thelephora terrestris]
MHKARRFQLTWLWGSLVPLMITRLMLSLKKAANTPGPIWGTNGQLESVRFARRTFGGTERRNDDIAMRPLTSEAINLSES